MKINFLIILILIILSSISSTYAYWTDVVNSKISLKITYDAFLNVSNVPEPIIPIIEELPMQVEVEGVEIIEMDTDIENQDNSVLNTDNTENTDVETEVENVVDLDFENPPMETEGENNTGLNSDGSDSTETELMEVKMIKI